MSSRRMEETARLLSLARTIDQQGKLGEALSIYIDAVQTYGQNPCALTHDMTDLHLCVCTSLSDLLAKNKAASTPDLEAEVPRA
jgi:hypothetical protein